MHGLHSSLPRPLSRNMRIIALYMRLVCVNQDPRISGLCNFATVEVNAIFLEVFDSAKSKSAMLTQTSSGAIR